ncbi:hypothetical protein BGZ46_002190 [Entomortierella lignicola]|nr:hypothetical protein BGZ46_002190 [Entomortierella lignicola]
MRIQKAIRFIWDTSFELDISLMAMKKVRDQLDRPRYKFSNQNNLLICAAEDELATGIFTQEAMKNDLVSVDIIDIFRSLKIDLPSTYFDFDIDEAEDTFVHRVLHSVISTVFKDLTIKWANKAAEGSKERRKEDGKEGLRPNLQISKSYQAILFLEAKSPSRIKEAIYLSDHWKLVNLAKDELDSCLRRHFKLEFFTTIQVFGHKNNFSPKRGIPFTLAIPSDWLHRLRVPPIYELTQSRPRPNEFDDIKKTRISPSNRKMF